MSNNIKKSHKGLTVLLIILCIIVIGMVALYFYQKDNINAVVKSVKYSKEDIQQQIDDSKQDVENTLKEYNIDNLKDFSFEEEEKIRKGQITYEQALSKMMEESGLSDKLSVETNDNSTNISAAQNGSQSDSNSQYKGESQSNNGSTSGPVVPNIKANSDDPDAIVSEYAIKLYALKAYYLGQIGDLAEEAKADYKVNKNLKSIASQYLGRAANLENEADAAVDGLLSELEQKLNSIGADSSVCETMKSAYVNEKNLKKSYYLSLYQKKG